MISHQHTREENLLKLSKMFSFEREQTAGAKICTDTFSKKKMSKFWVKKWKNVQNHSTPQKQVERYKKIHNSVLFFLINFIDYDKLNFSMNFIFLVWIVESTWFQHYQGLNQC